MLSQIEEEFDAKTNKPVERLEDDDDEEEREAKAREEKTSVWKNGLDLYYDEGEFEKAFTEFDKDKSGTVDRGEMEAFIRKVSACRKPGEKYEPLDPEEEKKDGEEANKAAK